MALAGVAAAADAQSLTALSTFGVNGWRAVNAIQAGDSAGSNNGTNYSYLGTGNLERGLAYNRATGNLILVSRSTAGNGIRRLSGTTGDDLGRVDLGTGIISGGTFTTNKVGVSDDGEIYVSNLVTNAATTNFKIYKWGSETAVGGPSVWHNATLAIPTGTARYGDSFDVMGSGASARVVAGSNGTIGYTTFLAGVSSTVSSFSPTIGPSKFRLGLTFGATDGDVLGKVTSDDLFFSSYSGTTGTGLGSTLLTSAGESPMDYATIGGVGYLAALDVNNSRLYIYNMSNPLAPVSIFPSGFTTTTGTLAGNGNASGDVKWGAIDQLTQTATIYAMSTNQGIQAFTFTVPAPGAAALLGMAGLAAFRRRR